MLRNGGGTAEVIMCSCGSLTSAFNDGERGGLTSFNSLGMFDPPTSWSSNCRLSK